MKDVALFYIETSEDATRNFIIAANHERKEFDKKIVSKDMHIIHTFLKSAKTLEETSS